ncbi:MAG: lysophospholipid acyltransferase family protein [Terracidiphilus sp.]|jgi:1-acyl-sn-glycerol-3-phosphate acyltransferase
MIVSVLVFVTILALSLPSAVVLIPFTLVTRNAGPLYAVGCWITHVTIRVAGIRVQIEGPENIPAGRACIFMANHVSNLDAPVLIANLPGRTSVFLKRPLMKLPVLAYAFKLASFIPVARDGQVEAARQAVAQARSVLLGGLHFTVFVEGKRSPDGRMLPFKKGPFHLAMDSGAPCIPVSIYGTEEIIPWGSNRIHPGTAHVVFHSPIDPTAYTTRDDLSAAVRAAIASSLPDWMRS